MKELCVSTPPQRSIYKNPTTDDILEGCEADGSDVPDIPRGGIVMAVSPQNQTHFSNSRCVRSPRLCPQKAQVKSQSDVRKRQIEKKTSLLYIHLVVRDKKLKLGTSWLGWTGVFKCLNL